MTSPEAEPGGRPTPIRAAEELERELYWAAPPDPADPTDDRRARAGLRPLGQMEHARGHAPTRPRRALPTRRRGLGRERWLEVEGEASDLARRASGVTALRSAGRRHRPAGLRDGTGDLSYPARHGCAAGGDPGTHHRAPQPARRGHGRRCHLARARRPDRIGGFQARDPRREAGGRRRRYAGSRGLALAGRRVFGGPRGRRRALRCDARRVLLAFRGRHARDRRGGRGEAGAVRGPRSRAPGGGRGDRSLDRSRVRRGAVRLAPRPLGLARAGHGHLPAGGRDVPEERHRCGRGFAPRLSRRLPGRSTGRPQRRSR